MQPQLFLGNKPDIELFKPIANRHFVKPHGGLWTSTYENRKSDWIEWCEAENYHANGDQDMWLLYPFYELKVYEIDNEFQLYDAIKQFPDKDNLIYGEPKYIDYEKMSTFYDAVHLTWKGQQETRWSTHADLYGWDCESTLWLNWGFRKSEYLGKYEFKETEYE